ncbi:EamA family transporter [Bacillus licheniformis]
MAFHFILWFRSLEYTSVASSVVLVTLQPIFSFIGTYFLFKERVSFAGIISALLAIGGSVYISWGISK